MANGKRKPMRQGQQNRRGRGRGRKVQNPLSRNYESNGPDVKIRGNAAHIAEKYAALARDAQASSDTVMAENFLQHAEHYNRIIMAAQAQNVTQQAMEGANGSGAHRGQNDQNDDDGDVRSDDETSDAEIEAEVSAAEKPKGNGRSRRGGGGKDNAAKPQGDTAQSEAQQSEAQDEDMASESDNATA